jgi:hypothetical protein
VRDGVLLQAPSSNAAQVIAPDFSFIFTPLVWVAPTGKSAGVTLKHAPT